MKRVRIGLIGVGGIMNGVHIPEYLELDNAKITAICDISGAALESTAKKLNLQKNRCFKDYKELIDSGLVDAVDIATPNDSHCLIAGYALDKGLPVSIEKPIGLNFEEAKALAKKSDKTGIPVFVCFSNRYHNFPRYMKYLIDKGEIGEIYHIYVRCIKNSGLWEGRRLEWRFDEKQASSGVLCDLGSHMFDMIRFFGQEFVNVYCDRGIVIKHRQLVGSDEWGEVTTDDWANVSCRLKSGIGATVAVSRIATTENDKREYEIFGSNGSIKYISCDGKMLLTVCAGDDVKGQIHRKVEIPESFSIGGQSQSFVNMLLGQKDEYAAMIHEGLKSQVAVDAAVISSKTGKAIAIEEMFND